MKWVQSGHPVIHLSNWWRGSNLYALRFNLIRPYRDEQSDRPLDTTLQGCRLIPIPLSFPITRFKTMANRSTHLGRGEKPGEACMASTWHTISICQSFSAMKIIKTPFTLFFSIPLACIIFYNYIQFSFHKTKHPMHGSGPVVGTPA